MKNKSKASEKEFSALMFVLALSPGLRMLPRLSAEFGGRTAWIGAIFAFGPVVLVWLTVRRLGGMCRDGEGFGDMLIRKLGKVGGRIVCIIFLLWLIAYIGFLARVCGERYMTSEYENDSSIGYIVAVLLLGCLAARGNVRSLTRAAGLFMAVLIAAVALVTALAVKDVKISNLLPISYMDALPVLGSAVTALDAATAGVYAVFLTGEVEAGKKPGRAAIAITAILLLLFSGVNFVTVGCYGSTLTAKLQNPFFALIRNLKGGGDFERIEALVIALWVVADFSIIGMNLLACCKALKTVFGTAEHRVFALPVTAAAGAAAYFVAPDAFVLQWLSDRLVPMVHLGFALVILPLLLTILSIRKKE